MTKITKYSLPFPEMDGKTNIFLPYTPDRQNLFSLRKPHILIVEKNPSGLNIMFSHFTLKDQGEN